MNGVDVGSNLKPIDKQEINYKNSPPSLLNTMYHAPHKLKSAAVPGRSTKNDNKLAVDPAEPQKTATGAGYFFSLRNGSQWFISKAKYSEFLIDYRNQGNAIDRSACVRKHGQRS